MKSRENHDHSHKCPSCGKEQWQIADTDTTTAVCTNHNADVHWLSTGEQPAFFNRPIPQWAEEEQIMRLLDQLFGK